MSLLLALPAPVRLTPWLSCGARAPQRFRHRPPARRQLQPVVRRSFTRAPRPVASAFTVARTTATVPDVSLRRPQHARQDTAFLETSINRPPQHRSGLSHQIAQQRAFELHCKRRPVCLPELGRDLQHHGSSAEIDRQRCARASLVSPRLLRRLRPRPRREQHRSGLPPTRVKQRSPGPVFRNDA